MHKVLGAQDPAENSCLLLLFPISPFPSPALRGFCLCSRTSPTCLPGGRVGPRSLIGVYLHSAGGLPIPKQGSAARVRKPGRRHTVNQKVVRSLCSNMLIQSLDAQILLPALFASHQKNQKVEGSSQPCLA